MNVRRRSYAYVMVVTSYVAALRRHLVAAILRGTRTVTAAALELTGFAAVTYGVWLVYEPAGLIVGGALAVLASFLLERGGSAA